MYSPMKPEASSQPVNGAGLSENREMSIAYPVVSISVTTVVDLEAYRVTIGSVWTKGNLLFRATAYGRDLLTGLNRWALGEDGNGRTYILYPAVHPRSKALVIQPMDSYYCFEISPFEPSA